MTETIADRLHVSTADVKPIDIDWSREAYHDGESDYQSWEPFTYTAEDENEYTLISAGGCVAGVVLEGSVYDKWSDLADLTDEPVISEETFDELMAAEPYMYGAEGPMMNYWYPLDETEGGFYSSFDPIHAAAQLAHLPLCVVLVDDTYGLALTGGGMDLSWEICDGYVRLGKCPPVHFADLPVMADRWSARHERVTEGMRRSLEFVRDNAQHRLDRLSEIRSRFNELSS